MIYWKKLSHQQQDTHITEALKQNIDYRNTLSLGIPASVLDGNVFYPQAPFLKEAPLLRAYIQNPNHIGCHTLGTSEPFFSGTQDIEREVIELLATDMLHAVPQSVDGYIAAGGTEANIQAAWIYRNYFMETYSAQLHEIALLGSQDTHYSIAKAANLLSLPLFYAAVDESTRAIIPEKLDAIMQQAKEQGIRYFIVIANMATTMFGSVDAPDLYVDYLTKYGFGFKLHVDGAFGGFIYPISDPGSGFDFRHPHISSITLDAHKMLQAPYGTGVFLARKGLMEYVYTRQASYVNGMDITLSGSRSGTNAIAVWMILMTYGPYGWLEKINKLLYRTDWCCKALEGLGVSYFRHPKMNIITMRAKHVSPGLAAKFGLVPDNHDAPEWYKIVVMDHVEIDHLKLLIADMERQLQVNR